MRKSAIAVFGLMAVIALLLLAGRSGLGPSTPASASAPGTIDTTKIDADPGTGGIQTCISVPTSTPFSVDLVLDAINAADSNNISAGGDAGINFTAGDFTFGNPAVSFTASPIGAVAGFTAAAQVSTTAGAGTSWPSVTSTSRATRRPALSVQSSAPASPSPPRGRPACARSWLRRPRRPQQP